MVTAELHPQVRPVAFLLGTWVGDGQGAYPTIAPFRYREEIRFSHNGKPFLAYQQRTQSPEDGRPLHAESGYLRAVGENRVEFVIAQAIGFAEIEVGEVSGTRIDLQTASFERTPTAKTVIAVRRSIWLSDEDLVYELGMAMHSVPMTHHLSARLTRTGI
ncbi:MAG TPA: FABP family protein [Candidatus Limnocylindrales bacterium]|nr:FABP family protein [Candidatus Limnocylindrales bacterium]